MSAHVEMCREDTDQQMIDVLLHRHKRRIEDNLDEIAAAAVAVQNAVDSAVPRHGVAAPRNELTYASHASRGLTKDPS